MNITKMIVITVALWMGFRAHSSELTPLVQKHLLPGPASIVEEYVYDGTIALNPKYSIRQLKSSSFGLTPYEIEKLYRIFEHHRNAEITEAFRALTLLGMDKDSAGIVSQYLERGYFDYKDRDLTEYAPLIYTIPAQHIPSEVLVPVIPLKHITGKIAGDRIMVTDTQGNDYDFKLAEDRAANMKEIGTGEISKALIAQGFIGNHAQMERYMRSDSYFARRADKIQELQEKDPAQLTYSEQFDLKNWNANITWVVKDKEN